VPSIRVTEKGAKQDADAIELSDGRRLPLKEGLEMHDVPEKDAESLVEKGLAETFTPKLEDLPKKPEAEPITDAQNRKLHALYNEIGDAIKKETFLKENYGVEHTNELSKEEASDAIDRLTSVLARKESEEMEAEEGEVALPDSMSLPPGQAGQKAALKMEARDDKQIASEVAQIPEKAVEDWFYQFKQDGRTVTGLSYTGVMALMRKQENIDVKVLENEDKGDHYKVKARAIDKARNITFERTKRQSKKMELKSGEKAEDEFADVKAESKAIKKALQAVLSPRVVVRAYETWQEARR